MLPHFLQSSKIIKAEFKGTKTVSEWVRTRQPNNASGFDDCFVEPLSKQYLL